MAPKFPMSPKFYSTSTEGVLTVAPCYDVQCYSICITAGEMLPPIFLLLLLLLFSFNWLYFKARLKDRSLCSIGKKKKKQRSDSLLFKSEAKNCSSRGTKEGSPTKSLRNTDHDNCCIQSVHVEMKKDWIAYNETSDKKWSMNLC